MRCPARTFPTHPPTRSPRPHPSVIGSPGHTLPCSARPVTPFRDRLAWSRPFRPPASPTASLLPPAHPSCVPSPTGSSRLHAFCPPAHPGYTLPPSAHPGYMRSACRLTRAVSLPLRRFTRLPPPTHRPARPPPPARPLTRLSCAPHPHPSTRSRAERAGGWERSARSAGQARRRAVQSGRVGGRWPRAARDREQPPTPQHGTGKAPRAAARNRQSPPRRSTEQAKPPAPQHGTGRAPAPQHGTGKAPPRPKESGPPQGGLSRADAALKPPIKINPRAP